ncbi:MAG: sulfate adenylyltransferase [Terriglobia bacterium]
MSVGSIPHGGKLVDRLVEGDERAKLLEDAESLRSIRLDAREASDLEMIAVGAFSPLTGFMKRADYASVLSDMRLSSGLPWTIPITLSAADEEAREFSEGDDVALVDDTGRILATIEVEEKYRFKKDQEAHNVLKTTCSNHPGVQYLAKKGDVLIGGTVTLLNRAPRPHFKGYMFKPGETRKIFEKRGWRRVAGFQTRNPIHRAHEYIQKCALEIVDGLLLHPLVGETKQDDVPAEVRMDCYKVLIDNYYPQDRLILSVLPAAMRYAGPKEAIFHAIVRKNYGCTHFIVGRDHAGVGNYYGSFDAHHIFEEFTLGELGITPLFFDHAFYCQNCAEMASQKTCPHNSDSHLFLSGTELRQMLSKGKMPPAEFTRPEVAKVLISWATGQKG